jgi:CNT family concentrative nucleoside transporter
MRIISVLGLLALLGIAWAISYHRTQVRMRTVYWGIGLQLLFAVIILRKDLWSFAGMTVLGLLLVSYLLQQDRSRLGSAWLSTTVQAVAALALGALFTWGLPVVIPYLLAIIVVAAVVNARFRFSQPAARYLAALLVVLGVGFLISRGLYGQVVFGRFSDGVASFLALSEYGARFLFGNLAMGEYFFPGADAGWPGFGFQFAFKVLPTIIFFGGFMSVLYHLGVMQRVIEAIARFMRWTIGTSGAETLSCTANIFVGQTEAPLLIKPFLDDMTESELLTIMVGGFATIAGGVLAGYIAMGIPAGHLIAASVMSAPAALVVGKIIYPELAQSMTAGEVKMPDIDVGGNVIEAAANGITDGLKLAVNVGAMLIGFIALIAVLDSVFIQLDRLIDGRLLGGSYVAYTFDTLWSPVEGEYRGIFPGSLQTLFGALLRPLAWLMGVPWADAAAVGNLLGIKIALNEFVAYGALGSYIQEGAMGERATIISTYALCGFANFSSIGIQIGGIAAVAPGRRSDLARVGLKAMIGGAIASWLTATIAGMLL